MALITHYMDEAEQLGDQLVIVDAGRVIARGTPRDLREEHFSRNVLEFDNPSFDEGLLDKVRELAGIVDWSMGTDERVVLHSEQASATREALQRVASEEGRSITDITMRRPSLEDLFLILTGMFRQ